MEIKLINIETLTEQTNNYNLKNSIQLLTIGG